MNVKAEMTTEIYISEKYNCTYAFTYSDVLEF